MFTRVLPAGLRLLLVGALNLTAWPAVPAAAQSPGEPPVQSPAPAPAPAAPWYQDLSVNGLVEGSWVFNTNAPASRTNQFRVFDTDDRSLTLDEVELVLQRAIATPGQVGFRVDATFGATVPRVTASAGLFRDADGDAGDFDVHQAYLSYIAPAGRGLRIALGKFATHVGYEVINGYDGFNDHHSRGLLFGYAQPFTHTGVRVSYAFTDAVSGQVLLVNGWDNAVDNNTGKTIGVQLAVAPSHAFTLTANYVGGPEQPDTNAHGRHLIDLVAIGRPTASLALGANYDCGREAAVALPETAGGGVRDARWQGLAAYGRLGLTARTALSLRGEVFDDPQGARTGYAQTLSEFTLTPEFRPRPSFIVRGDLRFDRSNRAVFERNDGSLGTTQFTVSLNALVVF